VLRLVLLGDPVAHSLSPVMHRAAFAALGISGRYDVRRVDPEGMATAAGEVRAGTLDGANITMPHKRLAASLADELSPAARRAGSVNTWLRRGARLFGETTDVAGIRIAWQRAGLPADAPVLVLGAGGAAAAALVALADRVLHVAARRPSAVAALSERVEVDVRAERWGDAVAGAVVVNATPIGMHGEPLPDDLLDRAVGLFDMAYGPDPTPAVSAARARGLPVADGIAMLAAQAEVAFELWTGRPSPPGVMERAARKASSGESP